MSEPGRREKTGAIMANMRMVMVGILVVLLAACVKVQGLGSAEHHGRSLVGMDRQAVCVECHTFESARHHPSNVPYPPPGREQGFTPVRQLAARGITVQNGELTCLTCHDLHNREPMHLPVGMTQSSLCLACHQI